MSGKKFKIMQNPTFKSKVSIPRIGGEPIEVEFEFKYLSRKELAKVYDSWQEELAKLYKEDSVSTLTESADLEIEFQVMQLKDIIVGWDFDDEFSDENISALVEASFLSGKSIVETYQEAYTKAKLGN